MIKSFAIALFMSTFLLSSCQTIPFLGKHFVITNKENTIAVQHNQIPFPHSEFGINESLYIFIQGYSGQLIIRVWRLENDNTREPFTSNPLSMPRRKHLVSKINPGFGVQNVFGEAISGQFVVELCDPYGAVLSSQQVKILDIPR